MDYVSTNYCLNMKSIHMSGNSNGAMFTYFAASQLSDVVASMAPNIGSPLIGFGDVPLNPTISLIDFHGLNDDTIPYDINSRHSRGNGPNGSVISWDYYFYEQKPNTIAKYVTAMNCAGNSNKYPTPMDGHQGWSCKIWSGCQGGTEVVLCTGNYGHDYPFMKRNGRSTRNTIEGTRIMWDFMKKHTKP